MQPSDPQERQDGWYWVKFHENVRWAVAIYHQGDDEWEMRGIHIRKQPFEIGSRCIAPDERPEEPKALTDLRDICGKAGTSITWPWPLEYHEAQSVINYVDVLETKVALKASRK